MKDNLHYILEEDGRSLTVQNGVVNSTSQPTPLRNTPDGWRNLIVSWQRDLTKHGVIRSFTTPLGFVNDAAHILRDNVYRYGFERKLYFLIQQLTPEVDETFFRLIYRYLYKGELDLSTFKDEDTRVTCGIMEGGLSKLLKANEGTTYEIPFDDDAINVKMDGIYLSQNAKYDITPLKDTSDGFPNSNKDLKTLNISLINKEGTASGIALFDQTNEQIDGSVSTLEYMAQSSNYFAVNNNQETINLHISGTMRFRCTFKLGSISFSSDIKKNDDTQFVIFNNVALNDDQEYTQDFDFTIPLGPGEKLFWFSFFNTTSPVLETARIEYLESDLVLMDFTSRKDTTYVKAFKPFDLFKKLVERITGRATDAESTLLQNESNLTITCGDAIRGIEGAKVKTSLNQLFEHCSVAHFAGMGIEGDKIKIEKRSHYFNTENPIDLGSVSKMKKSFATDIMGNTFKIGWPDPAAEDVNGKRSFNGSNLYSSQITRVAKELIFISAYSADPYEIEITRINLEGKETTDSSTDNKNYVINVDITAPETVVNIGTVYSLKRIVYDSLEGVPTATVFNIEDLTPKRLAIKHGPWLRSILWPNDLQKIKFESTQRNATLKTVQGTEVIQENTDIDIFSIGERLFLPFYFEFDAVPPVELIGLLEENTNRIFKWIENGITYKGFLIKAALTPNTEEPQSFKMLSAPDNDLLRLINQI
jgi:hypothetical protein